MSATDLINVPVPSGGNLWGEFVRPRPAAFAEPLWATPRSLTDSDSGTLLTTPVPVTTIERYARLQPGWDGYRGVTPKASTVEAALRLYWALRPSTVDPDVQVAGDGEISLVWRAPFVHFEIGADADGGVSYFGRVDGDKGPPVMGELDERFDSLPVEVTGFLDRVPQWRRVSVSKLPRANTPARGSS